MEYVALLRGVNVGGKNMLPMPALRDALTAHGYKDVRTYINSGNILFSHEAGDVVTLKRECEELIARDFGISTPVAVLAARDLADAVAHAPAWWNQDEESKHNAIFVVPPATVEAVAAQVGEIKPEYEQVGTYGQVIFWSAPLKTFSRTRYARIVGTDAYGSVTIRNANTALKLAEMATQS